MSKMLNPIPIIIVFIFWVFQLQGQTVNSAYEDGNIYIKVKQSATNNNAEAAKKIGDFYFLNNFAQQFSVTEFKHLYAFARYSGLENIYKITIAQTHQIEQAVSMLSNIKELEYAEKVPYKKFFAVLPNDTSFNSTQQWNLFKINAPIAWSYLGASSPSQTTIAIVDDGMDINHVDLKDNVWYNDAERYGLPGVDDDGNFFVDDSLGFDFGNYDNDPSPNEPFWEHGTFTAGIAGAVTNNTTGIASISYNAKLMAVKGTNTSLNMSNGYEAIAYAADMGADIINLSWGSPAYSITEKNTIYYAYILGSLVVAAAGNNNDATVNYPAGYPHAMSVASTANNDVKSIGTSYGQRIDVCAPGTNIFSTIPGNGYAIKSGTSMASPLVAGLAALMKTYNPLLTADELKDCIKNNTDNIEFMNPNMIGKLGTGRINAYKAMQCVAGMSNQLDASLLKFEKPNSYSCVGTFTPQVVLKNAGLLNLQNVVINYQLDGGAIESLNWSGDIPFDSILYIPLHEIQVASGEHTLKAYCSNPNNSLDWNFFNDTISTTFKILSSGLSLPFTDNFEQGFGGQFWKVDNLDNGKAWQSKQGLKDGITNTAAFINLFNYESFGERDGLLSPPLNFSGYDSLVLNADYAWKRNFRQKSDSLIILASIDCGQTFPYRLAALAQDSTFQFATTIDTMDVYFNPLLSADWCGDTASCIEVNLTPLKGHSSVILKFETYNNFNNNLFLDNINISGISLATAPPSGITVNANPNSVCVNQTITLTANDPNNSSNQWNWTFTNALPATYSGQSVTVVPVNSGTVSASVQALNSQGTNTFTLASPVVVNPLPNVQILQSDTVLCLGNSIALNVSGAASYIWSPATALNDTLGNMVISTPLNSITYTVAGTSTNGCINTAVIHIDTTACLGLHNPLEYADLSMQYNAQHNQLMIVSGNILSQAVKLILYNSIGQMVFYKNLQLEPNSTIFTGNIGVLNNGIYFAELQNNATRLKIEKFAVIR